jgi:ribulose-phosphate 3-epimerase
VTPPVRVSASLLASDFSHLAEELRRAETGGADWHHVDVMDGHFVDNLTIGPPVVVSIRRVATLPLDVHLMIEQPARWAQRYADAGADLLSFHLEAAREDLGGCIEAFRRTGCRVGVAVNPDCGVEELRPHLDGVDLVLVMSVFAGFGGQRFLPEVTRKIRQLRDWGFDGDVEVDGGITDQTAPTCLEAGANVLVSGTYLYRADDIGDAVRRLRGQTSVFRRATAP